VKNPGLLFLVVVAATIGAQRDDAQQSPYRSLDVRSCPFADSLLGPLADDSKGNVRGRYLSERDSTYLTTTRERGRLRVFFGIKFVGPRPTRSPAAQLNIMFRGADGRKLAALPATPSVVIILDGSATLELTSVVKGTFVGPEYAPVTLPVSALIPSDDLVRVAQAAKIAVRVGSADVTLSRAERRDLRGLVRVSVCPGDN
jgi:hypothetical protein